MQDFLTLATFQFPAEYAILKLLFEQDHIRYFFQNETLMAVFPFTSMAGGGIRLKVHPEDFEKARDIYQRWQYPSHLRKV